MWDEFLDEVNQFESPGKVNFVHVLLPHHPYELDRNCRRVRAVPYGDGFDDLDSLTEDYIEQTAFVDELVGQLTDKLKEEKLYENPCL